MTYERSLTDRLLGLRHPGSPPAAEEPLTLVDIPDVERVHVVMTELLFGLDQRSRSSPGSRRMSSTDGPDQRLSLRVQLTRFVLTGGLSALVDFGLLKLLMGFGLDHNAAKALSFLAGTTTAYLINRRWTFQAEASKRRFAAVVALYGLTFAVQVGLFALIYPALAGQQRFGLDTAALVAFVIAQGAATTVNFIVQRDLLAFADRPDTRHGRSSGIRWRSPPARPTPEVPGRSTGHDPEDPWS